MSLSKVKWYKSFSLIQNHTYWFIITIVLACFLTLFAGIEKTDASISKPLSSTSGFEAPIALPPGFSLSINISFTCSGTISIKSPSGNTTSLQFNNISGPYSSDVNFSEIGAYEVSENYAIKVVAKSLAGNQESTSDASNNWTYNNSSIGTGKFRASSSVTGVKIDNIVGPLSASVGSSLPSTATVTTTDVIAVGQAVSVTVSSLWSVNSSIEPPPETGSIAVNTNHNSATFSLSGPSSYNGSGTNWSTSSALIGEYTITYGDVPGYATPPSEKKTLTLGGTITFSGQYIPKFGALQVNSNIDEANFTISGPEGISRSGSGKSWSVAETLIGKYVINFGAVSGYRTPPPSVQTLSEGGTITFTGNYSKLVPGTIEVQTNLDEASFMINGPTTYNGSGKLWVQTEVPLGQYTIVFNEVPGYETPKSDGRILDSGSTIIFYGDYKKIYPGTIEVYTNIDDAKFTLSGTLNYSGSGKAWSQSDVPIGNYTITYEDVEGYRTPPSETKTLISGGKITFNAKYRQKIPSAIEVYTNLDEATFELTGPANYNGGGKEWVQANVPEGEYTITYGEVPGYKIPLPQTQALSQGEQIIFNVEYMPHVGTIAVRTNLDEATFEISGRANYSGGGKEWTKEGTPVGEYTISFGNVTDHISPQAITQILNQDGTITFIGEYEKYKPGTIEVRSNIENASFTILGPVNYEGSGTLWRQDDAPPGEYIIFFDDITNYDKPQESTKNLASNETVIFTGDYTPHVGTISVNTNLDKASFRLSGPNEASYSGSGESWTQTNVLLGDYTITYDNVLFYESPPPETKTLTRDSEILFTGTYKPIAPNIQKVTVSGSPASINSTIRVTVTTDPKCYVTFSIEGIISGELKELTTAGTYNNSFKPPKGFDAVNVPVNIKVKNGIDLESTDSSQTLTIDTLAQIKSVALSQETPIIGDVVKITVIGDPKSNVSFSIKGLTQGQMMENKNNPGNYSAEFTALREVDSAPVEIKIIDASGNFAVNSDKTITVSSKFGDIGVVTNLDSAKFTVTNIGTGKTFSGSGKSWSLPKVSAGDYKITFSDVIGYTTPGTQTNTLSPNGTIIFNANYSAANGTIVVRTNLENAKFKVEGPFEYDGNGQKWSQQNAASGQYTITYEEVIGYETPSSETKKLENGGKLAFIGGYKPKYGTIEVVTNLEEAKFIISGTAEYNGNGRKWSQTLAPEGEYTIEFLEVPGYAAPKQSKATLCIGCNIIFYGTYTPADGTIIVRTNLDSAEFKITGPVAFEGSGKYWIASNAPTGEYTIEYKNTPDHKSPLPETKILAGGSIAFIGGYIESEILASPERIQFADRLMTNFPNPCNPGTWIPFSLSDAGEVNIAIYDIRGRMVRKLELGYKTSGIYVSVDKSAYWDGNNEYGENVVSGVYFYHIRSGNFSAIRRMLVTR